MIDRRLERGNLLAGPWRTSATDDPRGHTVVSQLGRGMLKRPAAMIPAFVVVVAAVMAVLLTVGPSGGRS